MFQQNKQIISALAILTATVVISGAKEQLNDKQLTAIANAIFRAEGKSGLKRAPYHAGSNPAALTFQGEK